LNKNSIFFLCSTIGDDIVGIWPTDVKKDHINCAHATSSTIVTGDDHGAVNLFKFPCPEPGVKIVYLLNNSLKKINFRPNIKVFMVIQIM